MSEVERLLATGPLQEEVRVRPVDRVAQQRDQLCRWCDLPQSTWRQWVKERVGRRFAGDDVRRELRRKLPEVPVETALVAVGDEMELLRGWGCHLGMGTEIGVQRRRAAALRTDDDVVRRRNRTIAEAWGAGLNRDSAPDASDCDRFSVRQDRLDRDLPVSLVCV
jgi:hypothetical protein